MIATYALFADAQEAEANYAARLADDLPDSEGLGEGSEVAGECSTEAFEGEGPYTVGGRESGRFYCYQPESTMREIVWVTPDEAVIGMAGAVLESGQSAQLLSEWAAEFGPGEAAKDTPDFPSGGATSGPTEEGDEFPTPNEELLIAAAPASVRGSCEREDPETVFKRALAGISCRGGPGKVYYELYPTLQAMRATYNDVFLGSARPTGVRRNQGSCIANPTGENVYSYGDEGLVGAPSATATRAATRSSGRTTTCT